MDKKRTFKSDLLTAVILFATYFGVMFCCNRISVRLGKELIVTLPAEAALAAAVLIIFRKKGLLSYYGFSSVKDLDHKRLLYYIPLAVIASLSLLSGPGGRPTADTWLCALFSVYIGFFEELLFRSLMYRLFRHKSEAAAVIISSTLFGLVHLVNLFGGQGLFFTLMQVVCSCVMGFAMVMLYTRTNNVIPCIITHSAADAVYCFCRERTDSMQTVICVLSTVIYLSYGAYILFAFRNAEQSDKKKTV